MFDFVNDLDLVPGESVYVLVTFFSDLNHYKITYKLACFRFWIV